MDLTALEAWASAPGGEAPSSSLDAIEQWASQPDDEEEKGQPGGIMGMARRMLPRAEAAQEGMRALGRWAGGAGTVADKIGQAGDYLAERKRAWEESPQGRYETRISKDMDEFKSRLGKSFYSESPYKGSRDYEQFEPLDPSHDKERAEKAFQEFKKARPDVDEAEFKKAYQADFASKRDGALIEHYRDRYVRGAADSAATPLDWAVRRAGFLRSAISLKDTAAIKEAAERIQAGKGGMADYKSLGQFVGQAQAAQQAGTGETFLEMASQMPAFVLEFLATRGVARGALGVGKIGGLHVTQAGAMTGMNPLAWAASTMQRQLPQIGLSPEADGHARAVILDSGESLGESLVKGGLDNFIENFTELAGGKIISEAGGAAFKPIRAKLVQAGILKALTESATPQPQAVTQFLKNSLGFHGAGGEMGEEFVADVARGLTGVNDDFGTLQKLAGSPEERERALTDLTAMGMLFAIPGVVAHIANRRDIAEGKKQEIISQVQGWAQAYETQQQAKRPASGLPGTDGQAIDPLPITRGMHDYDEEADSPQGITLGGPITPQQAQARTLAPGEEPSPADSYRGGLADPNQYAALQGQAAQWNSTTELPAVTQEQVHQYAQERAGRGLATQAGPDAGLTDEILPQGPPGRLDASPTEVMRLGPSGETQIMPAQSGHKLAQSVHSPSVSVRSPSKKLGMAKRKEKQLETPPEVVAQTPQELAPPPVQVAPAKPVPAKQTGMVKKPPKLDTPEAVATAAAEKVGIKLEMAKADDPQMKDRRGRFDPATPDKIKVSEKLLATSKDAQDVYYGVVVHEMHHSLRRTDPEAWNQISKAIEDADAEGLAKEEQQYVSDLEKSGKFPDYLKTITSDATRLRNEGVSRYVQRRLDSKQFVETLAGKEPGLFAKMLDAIRSLFKGGKNPLASKILSVWEGVAHARAEREHQEAKARMGMRPDVSESAKKVEDWAASKGAVKQVVGGLKKKGWRSKDMDNDAQEVILHALRKKDQYIPGKSSPLTWAVNIGHRHLMDLAKGAGRHDVPKAQGLGASAEGAKKPEPIGGVQVRKQKQPRQMVEVVKSYGGINPKSLTKMQLEQLRGMGLVSGARGIVRRASRYSFDDLGKELMANRTMIVPESLKDKPGDYLWQKITEQGFTDTPSGVMAAGANEMAEAERKYYEEKQAAEKDMGDAWEPKNLSANFASFGADDFDPVNFAGIPIATPMLNRLAARLPGLTGGGLLGMVGRKLFWGKLPKATQQHNRERKATIAYHNQQAENAAKDMGKAVKAEYGLDYQDADQKLVRDLYGSLTLQKEIRQQLADQIKQQKGSVSKADRAGIPQKAASIWERQVRRMFKPKTAESLIAFREHTDALSDLLVQSGAVASDMAATFSANRGIYLHRSYKVHDAKDKDKHLAMLFDPQDSEGQRIYNQAKNGLRQQIMDQGPYRPEDISDEALDGEIHRIAKNTPESAEDVLLERGNVPEWMRELMGEYKDAIVAYGKSAAKMARLLAGHQFTEAIKSSVGGGFVFDKPSKKAPIQLSKIEGLQGVITRGFKDADNLYVPEEFADGLKEAVGWSNEKDKAGFLKLFLAGSGLANYMATVGNPSTHVANAISGLSTLVANGINPKHLAPAFKAIARDTPEARAEHLRLTKLGIVGSGFDFEAMRELAHDFENAPWMQKAQGVMTDVKAGRAAAWFGKRVGQAYQATDQIYRVAHFYGNLAKYEAAGLSKAEAEKRAVEVSRDTYQNYDEAAPFVRQMNRYMSPVMGPFFSFAAESARNVINTFKVAKQDIQSDNPKIRKVGWQRAATGLFMVAGGPTLIASLASKFFMGVGDDDEEASRYLGPPWTAPGHLLWLSKPRDGKASFVDLSRWNYYALFQRPVTEFLRDGDERKFQDRVGDALAELAKPRLDSAIMWKAINEAWSERSERGRPIRGTSTKAKHVGMSLVPGAVKWALRIGEAGRGDGNLGAELGSLVGRATFVDARTSLAKGFVPAYRKALQDAEYPLRQLASKASPGDDQIEKAYAETDIKRREAWGAMRQAVVHSLAIGLTQEQVRDVLKVAGLSTAERTSLLEGRYRPWTPPRGFAKRAFDKAKAMGADAPAGAFADNVQALREQAERAAD